MVVCGSFARSGVLKSKRPFKFIDNLAKLDDGLAESPTVMVVDKTKKHRKNNFWQK